MSLNIVNSFKIPQPPPDAFGGWKELGRTTLGATNSNITVSGLSDKRYYMLLCDYSTSLTNGDNSYRFNNDNQNNYAQRFSFNGETDGTFINNSQININGGSSNRPNLSVSYLANLTSREKLLQVHVIQSLSAGAADSFTRVEQMGKWANIVSPINRIDSVITNAGVYNTGSELVVLEWDPADTHTDNFWEELTSKELTSSGSLITDNFAAKKYLWIQIYNGGLVSSNDFSLRFNDDAGSNYSTRFSVNNAADSFVPNDAGFRVQTTLNSTAPQYYNLFMVNKSAEEKLGICHGNLDITAGAGTGPQRQDTVGKWTNTSSQITKIQASGSNFGVDCTAPSWIKVWGSD